MSIFLPVAGISINIWALISAGGLVGFLSGLLGVGGGFLLTPILILLGIPPTVAAASDSCQIVAGSSSAVAAHFRLGNVDFKMGVTLLAGGLTGAGLGVQAIKVLRAMGNADFLINVTYVLMLGLVGGYMFIESLQSMRKAKAPAKNEPEKHAKSSAFARFSASLPWQMEFKRSGVRMSPLLPLFLGGVVGVLSAIMGVGGGFIMVPVMVYLLRMPMHVVVGTSLFQILFTCVNVTVLQSWMNHTVDIVLALILLVGSVIGAQVGARASKRLKADQLKILMAIIVLLTMGKMLLGLLLRPEVLLGYKGGH